MNQPFTVIYPEYSIPSSMAKEMNVNNITNFHLFFVSKKLKKIHANDEGMNVNEKMSPIPGFLGEPKSIKSKTLRINASVNHVAKPTIQKIIYISTQLILLLGISNRVTKRAILIVIGNHNPFAPRSRLLRAVESIVSPPNITNP
ncbi:hypothetical protein [Cytobacillus horneckiae]|uniref:hypothetical protein n=2 Tax=Cytobacillus horneckiae TaxID=549687 RepID=UPI0019D2C4A3|nr:hypothetical protein [Cytobacillus horneckiae]